MILKLIFLAYLVAFFFVAVSGVWAQIIPPNPSTLVPCGLNGAADCTLCHLVIGFQNIYNYLLFYVLFPATVAVIVIAGIMYMVSAGSKGLVEAAKKAFTYALAALVIALTAWLLVNAILHAVGYKNAGNWWTFTCDTTQSTNAGTLGANGSTLPGNTGNKGGGISGKGSDIEVPQDGSKLAQVLEKEKGAVYVYGGDPNNRNADGNLNTDCSGWVQAVYKETYGVNLPRTSGDQTNQSFDYSQLTNGTILGSPGHVGIYYNGSVYNNSTTGGDVKAVELSQYLSNHNVTSMHTPPS